jgi:hypothetical protein
MIRLKATVTDEGGTVNDSVHDWRIQQRTTCDVPMNVRAAAREADRLVLALPKPE